MSASTESIAELHAAGINSQGMLDDCLTSANIQNGEDVCIMDTLGTVQPSPSEKPKENVINASVLRPDCLSAIVDALGIQQDDESDTNTQLLQQDTLTLDNTNTKSDQVEYILEECPKEQEQPQQTATEDFIAQPLQNQDQLQQQQENEDILEELLCQYEVSFDTEIPTSDPVEYTLGERPTEPLLQEQQTNPEEFTAQSEPNQRQLKHQQENEEILEELLNQFEASLDEENVTTGECPQKQDQTTAQELIAQPKQKRQMTITQDGDIEFILPSPTTQMQDLQTATSQPARKPIDREHIKIQEVEILSPNQCFPPATLKEINDSDQQIIAHIDENSILLPTSYPLETEIQPQIAIVDGETVMYIAPSSIPEILQLAPQELTNTAFQSTANNHQPPTDQVIPKTLITEADTTEDIEDHVLPKFMITTFRVGSIIDIKPSPQVQQQQIVHISSKPPLVTGPQSPSSIKKADDGTFKCKEHGCNKAFNRKEHLLRHIDAHYGKRMFSCDKCHNLFSRKDNLNKHRKTHKDPPNAGNFACEICNKSFAVEMNLTEHKLVHKKDVSSSAGAASKNDSGEMEDENMSEISQQKQQHQQIEAANNAPVPIEPQSKNLEECPESLKRDLLEPIHT